MGKIKTQFDSRYFFSKHSSLEETHARVEQHVSTGGPQTWTNKSQIRPASGWLCRRGLAPILVLCAKSPRLMVPCAFLLRKPMKRSEPLRMVLAQRHYGMMG
jgi:hypothetical protein